MTTLLQLGVSLILRVEWGEFEAKRVGGGRGGLVGWSECLFTVSLFVCILAVVQDSLLQCQVILVCIEMRQPCFTPRLEGISVG